MDLLVLQRLTAELDEKLRGCRIEQVWALPKNDVVFAVDRRSAPRLWFSAEPDEPHLYLREGGHATPDRPPGFAMAARNFLVGRRIDGLRLVNGDRIVELLCSGEDGVRVIYELIPRRATALVLDATGEVKAAWQARRGRPGLGDPYVPPPPDQRPPPEVVESQTWKDLAALPDEDALARGLLRSIAGMSPLMAREIAWRHAAGTALREAVSLERQRAVDEPPAPRIYAPQPPERLTEPPHPHRFLPAPYVLHYLEEEGDLHVTPYDTLLEATATFYPLRAALTALRAARQALVGALEIGVGRARRTLDAVADDSAGAGDAAQHRLWADLLLAYPRAERHGGAVRVPDPSADPSADRNGELEIPIDPARSLVDNAQAYYDRARRAERSADRTAARRRALERRIDALETLLERARESGDLDTCADLAREARQRGVTVDASGWFPAEGPAPAPRTLASAAPRGEKRAGGKPARGAGPAHAGIDRYTSSDGFEILVGRNARGNERLTHKLAAPHDFWLHAEGPGSHVVLRNPRRDETPSSDALREAAALAAHFSRARGATKVNVRWTQARHVKKPRGAPAGQVILRASHTFLAEPISPAELFGNGNED